MANYSKEEILKKIEELGQPDPWFHYIDLGNGIKTMPQHVPHLDELWKHIERHIPQDLSGMSVLDIGCNAGFFSIAAKRKKADQVLGIDISENYLRQAEFIKNVLGLNIEYRKMSVYDLASFDRKFDLVFFLGVIYHCADPFSAAKAVARVTDRIAIVESAIVSFESFEKRPTWEFVFPGYKDQFKIDEENERSYNWWFPNMAGLSILFLRAGFKLVEKIYERGDRGTIICYK